MTMINNNVMNANATFEPDAKSAAPCPPPILLIATGIKLTPIIVTTEPVTTGGKNGTKRPNTPAMMKIIAPEAIIDP